MKKRKIGYYWVKPNPIAKWEIMRWCGEWWLNMRMGYEPKEVGRRIPSPDEPWVCVPKEPTIEMVAALGFGGDVDLCIGHSAISEEIFNQYVAMLAAAPSPEDI